MSKEATRSIQTGLIDHGYDLGKAGADGVFGRYTREAATAWLAADGKSAAPPPQVPASAPAGGSIRQGSAGHLVREIVVHCAATQPSWMVDQPTSEKVAEVRRWHKASGWRDIGYHWIIDRDGSRATGRAETAIGAGVAGHNRGVIHICLIGGHGSASTDRFDQHFTADQDKALRQLIAEIGYRTAITKISGHNQYAAKACPGFHVPSWLKGA